MLALLTLAAGPAKGADTPLGSPRTNQGCSCGPSAAPEENDGIVWVGTTNPGFREIVGILAPIFWYTADEPAIILGDTPIPHRYPCDPEKANAKEGIVYYQVNWLIRREAREAPLSEPVEEDPRFFEKVSVFALRYYIYHRFDYGLNGHEHDLEMAEFRIALEQDPNGCNRIRLTNVIGYAHGTDWYSNELLPPSDTRYPIALFVEEGKHALGPDRNADGIYTPGYDISVRINDAWGIRDILGSGYLVGGAYSASMFKPRVDGGRVLPPETHPVCTPRLLQSIEESPAFLNRYELRPGYRMPICRGISNEGHLEKWTRKNEFGVTHRPQQFDSEYSERLSRELVGPQGFLPKVAFRYDRGPGFALTFAGFDATEFYVVPKFNLNLSNYSFAIDALFTRTATQFSSPYFALGYTHERPSSSDSFTSGFGTEAGYKFRLRVDWPWRILGAGYEFAGIRLGVRKTGFDNLGNFRFIVEAGAGLW